jgi:hypothetical protein
LLKKKEEKKGRTKRKNGMPKQNKNKKIPKQKQTKK